MKIDRRSFLAFSIGGAAGTALTPLPWKLTDDLSIWSQMWPWTPVPPDGEYLHVKSTCPLCPGGCGIDVRTVDGRAVKIEGLNEHPINDGGICMLGLSGLQLLYGESRVRGPLKKVNGGFQKISWDAAIEEISVKLEALREKGQPGAVACIGGTDRGIAPALMKRFLKVYGSPNFIAPADMQASHELAAFLSAGANGSVGFDVENAGYILSFGSGLIDGWGSPVRLFKANSRWRDEGRKVVQIEPRLSNTATKADQWIPITPGSEGALALGLAHVIVTQSLYDRGFVEGHSSGFNAWTQKLLPYTPEKVAELTGVDTAVITAIAQEFAKADKPLALCGRGQGRNAGSISEFMAVQALNALVGNINQPGGLQLLPRMDYINWPEPEIDAIAAKGLQQTRIDGAGDHQFPYTQNRLHRFPQVLAAGNGAGVEVAFVMGANPAYTLKHTDQVQKALRNIPLLVSFSSYLDETAQLADLVLPSHSYLERYEDIPTPAGYVKPFIGLSQPVVSPQYDTRYVGDVVIELAGNLGGTVADAFEWESFAACMEETLADRWDALVSDGYVVDGGYAPAGWDSAFETASAKFEFVNAGNKDGELYQPIVAEGESGGYPLTLVPYDSMRLANAQIGNPPFMTKTVADTILKKNDVFVEVNPATAKKYRLSDGKTAVLSTPVGKAKVRVSLFEGIAPDVVALPTGLGHTAYDKYLAGKGVNFNALIAPVEDLVSGLDAAWGIRAKLSKA